MKDDIVTNTATEIISEGIKEILSDLPIQCQQISHNVTEHFNAYYIKKEQEQKRMHSKLQKDHKQLTHQLQHTMNELNQYQHCVKNLIHDRVGQLRRRNVLRVSGIHVITKWRNFVRKRQKARWMISMYHSRHCVNLKHRYYVKWVTHYMRVKRNGIEQRYEKKLNTIAEQIVSRYEGELNKLRSDLAKSCDARKKMENHMRHTLLQSMSAMSIETMQLFNDEGNEKEDNDENRQPA